MRARLIATWVLSFALSMALIQGCGSGVDEELLEAESGPPGGPYVTACAENVELTPTLQALRGYWVKVVLDPNVRNPPTMRLCSTATNTLSGRLFVAGGYADTGVHAVVRQEGEEITMTLTDDELRPHDYIPKVRVFRGKFDQEKKTLTLNTPDGEHVEWNWKELNSYTTYFSARIYRCVVVTPPPAPAGTPAPLNPAPGTVPPAGPASSTSSLHGTGFFRVLSLLDWALEPSWAVAPRRPGSTNDPSPASTATPQPRSYNSCGVSYMYQDHWERMSGAD